MQPTPVPPNAQVPNAQVPNAQAPNAQVPNAQAPIAHVADLPDRSEADQQAFYHATMERALLAEARAGVIRHRLDLAGVRITLCFSGELLARRLMPALRHLEVAADGQAHGRADAVFHVWDSASSGIEMVPP